jgi:signal-transduction protein with cAMP-binding, CBS, and nucleotidyltransferase domain
MPLNFAIVEAYVAEYHQMMQDKTLLRHDRYRILEALREKMRTPLRDYEVFEAELSTMLESIGRAKTYKDLQRHHQRSTAGIRNYFLEEQTIPDVHDLFRIVRDSITMRVLELVEQEMEKEGFGPPPVGYCWIGLGSEGRDEQTFVTDQDNMIIHEDADDDPASQPLRQKYDQHIGKEGQKTGEVKARDLLAFYFQQFAARAVERLDGVGFAKCKGDIMPSNEKWRGSVMDWSTKIQDSLVLAKENLELLDLIILQDARLIRGPEGLFTTFVDAMRHHLRENRQVMQELASTAVVMPIALGFFGKFKVESTGEQKGKFNIKLFGWAPLIMSVRALGQQEGLLETNTLKRLRRLRDMNLVKRETEADLIDAYLLFVRYRIHNQLNSADQAGINFVDPEKLPADEAAKIRKAMRTVEAFQKYINEILLFGQPI